MLVCEVAGFHLGSPRSDLVHHLLLEMTTSLSAAWPGTWLPSVTMKDLRGHQNPVQGFGITELRGLTAQLAFCTCCMWCLQIPEILTYLQQATKRARRDLKLKLHKSTHDHTPNPRPALVSPEHLSPGMPRLSSGSFLN